jgi:phosphohistidine swiveling domain-containing protein
MAISPDLIELNRSRSPEAIGHKAENLRRLMHKRLAVPRTYVIPWHAYQKYLENDESIVSRLQESINRIIRPGKCYAVRSSANIEDCADRSFAGQFRTMLDCCDAQAILVAIWSIWATARSQGVQSYLGKMARQGTGAGADLDGDLKMAVIIQEMVRPVVSGVAFSRNPVTALDEVVVEAVCGPGTTLVQEGVTPMRWVNKWGAWLEQPAESPLPPEMAQQVVEKTRKLADGLGKDIDLEWVYDGQQIYWVQMREITSLDGMRIYANKISREMIPGQIKPLLMSTVIPMKVRQITNLMEALSGVKLGDPSLLIKSFYYHIYFEMNAFGRVFAGLGLPRDALEIMFGVYPAPEGRRMMQMRPQMLRKLPGMLRVAWQEWRFARGYHEHFPALQAGYRRLAGQPIEQLDENQLLALIDQLAELHQQTIHANVVVPVFMHITNGILRSLLRGGRVEFERFDLTEGLDELSAYQPGPHLAALNLQFAALESPLQAQVLAEGYTALENIPAAQTFKRNLDAFLGQFGHLSDSGNDFSVPHWGETPDLILQLAAHSTERRAECGTKTRLTELPTQQRHNPLFKAVYHRSRYFLVQREKASSLYTFSMALYRRIFLALGERLRQRGLLGAAEDIFYLYATEVRAAVENSDPQPGCAGLAASRREEMLACRETHLPAVIYGDELPPQDSLERDKLTGTPTSRGCYAGPARLVRSLADFGKLQDGDVLVIPYSDVGWTPLFARAGAVIAESGGMLSHSSIIAREYGIPAVVSVCGALQLPEGVRVTVNGYTGEILVHGQ